MPTIDMDAQKITMINTLSVKPENVKALLDELIGGTKRTISKAPGFISASFHVNDNQTRVVNYAQWESRETFEAMLKREDVQPHIKKVSELAESFQRVIYTVVHIETVS